MSEMHEISIAQKLIEQVAEVVDREGVSCISTVRIRVGPLSGVVPYALRSAFEIARHGTVCAKATLEIDEMPVRLACAACGEQVLKQPFDFRCPQCGGGGRLIGGRELELHAVVVDEPDEPAP